MDKVSREKRKNFLVRGNFKKVTKSEEERDAYYRVLRKKCERFPK